MCCDNLQGVLPLFRKVVGEYPDKIAIEETSACITFRELDAASDVLAHEIRSLVGGEVNRPIPIMMEKGISAVVSFLGVAKAHCFYVPIGLEAPIERMNAMFSVLNPPLVIVGREAEGIVEKLRTPARMLSYDQAVAKEVPADFTYVDPAADDPLYAIFTSGSTGVSKCVYNSHSALAHFITCFADTFDLSPNDVLANQAPFDFDISLKDIYTCLTTGATMVIVPKRCFVFPAKLLELLVEKRVTVMVWAVSAMVIVSQLKALGSELCARIPLRTVMFSGEVLPRKHLDNWREAFPAVEFINLYGPTEITCNCTYYRVPACLSEESLPIGHPFAHNDVFLVKDGKLVADGEVGEICVGGPSVALGYYGAPDLTVAAFPVSSLGSRESSRIYRTGDLGFVGEDGHLRFCGRADNQIKHMGHRIELTEIERALDYFPELLRCCCVYNEVASRIELYYSTENNAEISASDFANFLREKLPKFMVPTKYALVDSFPRTRNDKIDRKALKQRSESGE